MSGGTSRSLVAFVAGFVAFAGELIADSTRMKLTFSALFAALIATAFILLFLGLRADKQSERLRSNDRSRS